METLTLYPISNYLATGDRWVQVQHQKTSGEIEYVLLFYKDRIYVTVGSDYTNFFITLNGFTGLRMWIISWTALFS